MPGFVGPRRAVSRNGGGGARPVARFAPSGGVRRVTTVAPRRVVPTPRVVATSRPLTVAPKAELMPYYDPSRVIDLDRLKVVQDLRAPREFAAERGESQTGDGGTTGPGGTAGQTIAPPRVGVPNGKPALGNQGGLILAALAAALLLGG